MESAAPSIILVTGIDNRILKAGDSVEHGLMFSEVLVIPDGDYTALTAQTNLVNADGDMVTLKSKSVSKILTDDKSYGLGPSKGSVTYISLDTIEIEAGMVCTDSDGIIRIKKSSLMNLFTTWRKMKQHFSTSIQMK